MPVAYKPWAYKNDVEDLWGIELLEGEFAGTALSFNSFDIKDDSNDASLDYTVVKVKEGMQKEDVKGPEFEKQLGEIVNDILLKAIEHFEHENRNNNSAESDVQRGLSEEGNPVSKI